MVNRQLDSLTATRGFAAIMVVVFHFGIGVVPFNLFDKFFSNGNLAVSYFFTLSGFIMCYTYAGVSFGYKKFIKKRIARIVPLYLFALILSVFTILYGVLIHNEVVESHLTTKLLLNFTLLQAYIPGYALTINSPGWSLSVEMFFYLLFPLLIWLYNKNNKRMALASVLFFIISQIVFFVMLAKLRPLYRTPLHEFVFYNPLMHLSQFMVGIAGYYLFDRFKEYKMPYISLFLLILIVMVIAFVKIDKHNGVISPLFIVFIIVTAINTKSILNLKALVYLGEISYGIYILQMPVFYIVLEINKTLLHFEYGYFFWLYILILILVSAICYKYIEQPMRKKINALKI